MKTRRRKFWKWTLGSVLVLILLLVSLVNMVAYNHAYKLSHFEPEGITHDSIARMDWKAKLSLVLWGIPVARPQNGDYSDEEGMDTVNVPGERGRLELWHFSSNWESPDHIVLFPGYTRTKGNLMREAHHYRRLGFEVWLADFAGVGGSEGNVCTGGYQEALDVRDVFAHVRQVALGQRRDSVGHVLLHGNSMGSAAILRAVHELGVQPDGLVLETPFPDLSSALAHRLSYAGVPDWPLAQLVTFWGGVQQGYSGFGFCPQEYARSVRCPVLHLAGSEDPMLPATESRLMFDALGSRTKRYREIVTSEHGELYDLSSEEWEDEVEQFVSAQYWAGARSTARRVLHRRHSSSDL